MADLSQITKIYRAFVLVVVCVAIGAVSTLIILFLSSVVFAGSTGDAWARWLFDGDGYRFIATSVAFAAIAFPFVKRAKLKLV